jgi:hypothetical protein
MKKVIFLAIFMPCMAYGQIIENFESGNLEGWIQSSPERWIADPLSSISGSYSLHHIFDNPDAGNDRVAIETKNFHPSLAPSGWTFTVRHGYEPSSANNWAVFLMSSSAPHLMSVAPGTSGFAIGVNITGSDDSLRLVKIKDGQATTVVNCGINWQTSIGISEAVKILTERSTDGLWTVTVTRLNGTIVGSSQGIDKELFNPAWFGILYRYSSTRDKLLWIDDIAVEGNFNPDTEPPAVTEYLQSTRKSVKVTFNEPLAEESFRIENFSLNSNGIKPVSINMIDPLNYEVVFYNEFLNKTENLLKINNICDESGNCAENLIIRFTPAWAEPGDIVISEMMADPVPAVALPEREFIEIKNTTEFSFNLKNWKIKTTEQSYFIPDVILGPEGILILCAAPDIFLFGKFGKTAGLKQFPVLNDAGKLICLTDSSDNLINGVQYSNGWYKDALKKYGGWSLEMIDSDMQFFGEGNWKASVSHSGGTPGIANSVIGSNPDNNFVGIENVFPDDSLNIIISFSEPILNFMDLKGRIITGQKAIADIQPADLLNRTFRIIPAFALEGGITYNMEVTGDFTDFEGNPADRKTFSFGLPEKAGNGDILFNELLFNPWPGDPDYIELYNASQKIIDASLLLLVSVNDSYSDTSEISQISEKRCIMPDSYFAITVDKTRIEERYPSSEPYCLYELPSLPSMSDNEGHMLLYNRELEKIDEVFYNEKMHYSLLLGHEGIALEKTTPGIRSDIALNWHSAAESSGWGTPGARNSMFIETPVSEDKITLSSTRITPDNDGYEDFLTMGFYLTGNGNVISASIYDEAGNYVKKIASNMLAGAEASLIWDGLADDGTPVRSGIYIVLITLFDESGKTGKWKKVCTVIR